MRKFKFNKIIFWLGWLIIIVSLIFGLFEAINACNHGKISNEIGWFTTFATLLGIVFVGFQILEQQKEHQAYLHIYATWATSVYISQEGTNKDDYGVDFPGLSLHIIPVNGGLVPGTYRFLGITKKADWNKFLKPQLKKLKRGKMINTGIFTKKMYYQNKDVISAKSHRGFGKTPDAELSGNELLFPLDNKKFETIPAKGVGEIRNLPFYNFDSDKSSTNENNKIKDLGIKEKLQLNSYEKETLLIIYLDPDYNAYIKEIKIAPPDTDPSLQVAEGMF